MQKKTEHTKEKRKKTSTKKTAHSVSYCLVALFAFVCFCFVSLFWFAFLACVRILWHLHGFVFSVGFVCVYVVLLLLCLFFSRNLYCFSSYVFTNELIC